jgi:uncharacterized cupredoxin-like copper-binding protein
MRRFAVLAVLALPASIALVACGDDDSASGEGGVSVTLSEWIVEPDPATVDAGSITITGDNQGGELHELVVVKADSPSDLPTDADGAVDESAFEEAGIEEIGEVEDIESGTSADLVADLESGSYVLFCNITEEESDGTIESHYANGMVGTLLVN